MNTHNPVDENQLLAQISRERLWETNSTIARWNRHSGTDEEREAFRYVQGLLDEYGLQTTLLEHPALISYPLDASLTLLDDAGAPLATIPCLGTAYSATVEGLEAEVVDLGFGTPEDYARQDVRGKIVLLNGLATPTAVYAAEQAGAIGQIFINDDHLHYMIVSSIWGTPTPASAERIPRTPSVSVVERDGHELRRRIAENSGAGGVRVRLTSHVFMDWQQTPLLVADLPGQNADEFVLFSGHLDSWEVGAMDNGSANATMLEVARILAQHRDVLYRGLRLCFWSGHSHGRYSGSTWYADHFWEELHDHCVAHVNIDSTGARGATFYGSFPAHQELGPFGEAVVREQTGQETHARPMSRAGDMSFNGIGIPALFMSLSQVPFSDQDTDYVSLAFGKLIGGKMPWWWHTSEDTLDKIDLDVLELDTRIYLLTLWRLCHRPLLPMDFRPAVAAILETLTRLQAEAGAHLDLQVALERAQALAARAEELAQRCALVAPEDLATIQVLNTRMKAFSRSLIPILYTGAGRFDHDPAWGLPPIPLLADAPRLARMDPDSDEYHFLRTQLVRNRNAVNMALREALERTSLPPLNPER
ncbi:M28 family peptidase [Litorilinea aerophila]|uniref:M28 family peptidase n=1 Tax=Litorilinea aerophila TaxID=1204385 RepID=A0A540V9K3_9CHLR|nr:M28 family peptidase [Litorilinea aerophila]MCC9078685.1 M28 family peptidase [Litorilinea aerophila]GIV79697.1 MAG: peptidase M28 [Litorilinea sp.]